MTGSFEKMLSACRETPGAYRDICFESVGREAAGEAQLDIEKTKMACLTIFPEGRERENCVNGAVKSIIQHHRASAEGFVFCSALPKGLQKNVLILPQVMADFSCSKGSLSKHYVCYEYQKRSLSSFG